VELNLHYPNTPLWRDAKLKAQGEIYLYLAPRIEYKRVEQRSVLRFVWSEGVRTCKIYRRSVYQCVDKCDVYRSVKTFKVERLLVLVPSVIR
jgi:hypothetical protein